MLMVQGKRNYPLPLQPHPQNQEQNQPKTYIGFGTANGGTSNPCFYPCDPRRGFGFIKVPKNGKGSVDFSTEPLLSAGDDLLSHTVSHAVQSARRGLTAVFGMGTGVTPAV
jgi:hypothetical protein